MNEKRTLFNYLTPTLLGVLMFSSNFLNTSLFNFGNNNFSVWFVLSVLCFACGWFIDKTLGWHYGGKVIFSTIIGATIIGVLVITFFREYFGANELLTENLILYSLRNIVLGSTAFFGMSVVEVFSMQKDFMALNEKFFHAQKIINDADLHAKDIAQKKERMEKELKEFIQTERELIKKYEQKGES
jgi:hypothetical protein